MKKVAATIGAVVLLGGLSHAWGATLHVSPSGNNTPPYGDWATAATDIQTAIDASTGGDTILVGSGTYVLTSTLEVNKGVVVKSLLGARSTIIDGGYPDRSITCVRITTTAAEFTGFTVQNGQNGVRCQHGEGSAKVRNLVVAHNQDRGMEFISGGGAHNCTIAYNGGPGMYISDHGGGNTWINNVFWGNSTTHVSVATGQIPNLGWSIDDPHFVSTSDFRLRADSPCIDTGWYSPTYNGWVTNSTSIDAAGKARVYGDGVDKGAYEYQPDTFQITSFHGNGYLTWAGPEIGATCTVQWASSPDGPWFSDWSTLSALVVTSATTTVAVPMFYRVVSTTSNTPVARVNITAPDQLSSVPIENMDSFPPELGGSTIHCVLPTYDIVEWGRVEFSVTQSGYLYLAVNFGYQGNDTGGWTGERWLKADFEAAGWEFVAGTINGPGAENRDFEICRKLVEAGQNYVLRCNKYEPPYPIEPPSGFNLY